jgi:hypothetical protein
MFVFQRTHLVNYYWTINLLLFVSYQLKRQQKTESSRWLTARKPKGEEGEGEEAGPSQRDRFKVVDNDTITYVVDNSFFHIWIWNANSSDFFLY